MNAKHTPGPLVVEENEVGFFSIWTDHPNAINAELASGIGEKANAVLFHAAPGLLAACEAAETTLVDIADTDGLRPEDERTLAELRAAIAKAKGAA